MTEPVQPDGSAGGDDGPRRRPRSTSVYGFDDVDADREHGSHRDPPAAAASTAEFESDPSQATGHRAGGRGKPGHRSSPLPRATPSASPTSATGFSTWPYRCWRRRNAIMATARQHAERHPCVPGAVREQRGDGGPPSPRHQPVAVSSDGGERRPHARPCYPGRSLAPTIGVMETNDQPPCRRDQPVPLAAPAQPGRLVRLGAGGAGGGEGPGQADLPQRGLQHLLLVPRDGAGELRERGGGGGDERAVHLHQGGPRGAAGRGPDVHDGRAAAHAAGRVADERVADAGPAAVLRGDVLPGPGPRRPAWVRVAAEGAGRRVPQPTGGGGGFGGRHHQGGAAAGGASACRARR